MNQACVEPYIRSRTCWKDLPNEIQQQLGTSQKEYDKAILSFSVKNQVRFKGNLVENCVRAKDEKKYYNDILDYSIKNLMLFPYHLADVIVKKLDVSPFQFYVSMLEGLMAQDKSYDSLPNFTAADCLRLLGIGRNQYIELMNNSRSSTNKRMSAITGFFNSRKSGRDLLPDQPVESIAILPWWVVQVGFITEDDINKGGVDKDEHCLIDQVIDGGPCQAGTLNQQIVRQLYRKGLIYFDVPISEDDHVVVPTLEGFVMNRVLGDFFETLLYKIFVSIDEHTSVGELASLLDIDKGHVQDAVSLYCRLGFAKKKRADLDSNDLHPSWYDQDQLSESASRKLTKRKSSVSSDEEDSLIKELNAALGQEDQEESNKEKDDDSNTAESDTAETTASSSGHQKKIGFLFDSTLTAYLMMGNLSPGLKGIAVTMFERGKLDDESMDSLLEELEGVSQVEGEGEAARYFSRALTLKDTIRFFRQNDSFRCEDEVKSNLNKNQDLCLGLDLIRCESLQSLDPSTASKLLNKNYSLLISMAPLVNEIRPLNRDLFPPHLGPPIPEISSIWFKIFVYHVTGSGPPSLLLPKGTRIRKLPKMFSKCSRLLVTTWGHDPSDIPYQGALVMILDALQHSAVLVQAFPNEVPHHNTDQKKEDQAGISNNANVATIPFPLSGTDKVLSPGQLETLRKCVDIEHTCGYITVTNLEMYPSISAAASTSETGQTNNEESFGSSSTTKSDNVHLEPSKANLLSEEIDSCAVNKENTGGGPDETDKPMTLDLELKETAEKEERKKDRVQEQAGSGNWVLLDVNFGVPLFDAELNRDVCNKIVTNGLWKSESLELLSHSSRKLCLRLMSFIAEYQDLPVIEGSGKAPNVSRSSSIKSARNCLAMPTKSLFFDGAQLKVLKNCDGRSIGR